MTSKRKPGSDPHRGPNEEDTQLFVRARVSADQILDRCFGIHIRKAFELNSPGGFDSAVAELASLLRAQVDNDDTAAVRAAIAVLDVNWTITTPAQRSALVARALDAAGRRTAHIAVKTQVVFGDAAQQVVQATRDASRRQQRLAIAADFNALDRRLVAHLRTSQAHFVTDEYGRRHGAFSEEARQIVSQGLEAGLGRDDITDDLERAAQSILAGRSRFYWEVVAGAFIGQGRSFAQLSSYAEAGIERYLIEAVLDESTTDVCRFLHGKSFSVDRGLQLFDQVEATPRSVKDLKPWVRVAADPDAGRKALYVNRSGERVGIAEVVRSAVGSRDDRGEFARGRAESELMNLGVSFPPYHGLCRTTTVAAIS